MSSTAVIVVTSKAFSKDSYLVEALSKQFPNSRFNHDGEKFTAPRLLEFLQGTNGAIIGLERIDEDLLRHCPKLQIVSKFGVGLDDVDVDACARLGVQVGWTAGVNSTSVAEQTLGFMLAAWRNLYQTSTLLKSGTRIRDGGLQLTGRTVGIIGVGHVGKEVVRLLEPFRCRILVNDIVDQSAYYESNSLEEVSKKDLLEQSDIVTLHTPLNSDTHHMINSRALKLTSSESFLVNTARGMIVCQDDLKRALNDGVIAGAAIDVYEDEPPKDENFMNLPNLICTSHIGGNSREAVRAMGVSAIGHMERFFNEVEATQA